MPPIIPASNFLSDSAMSDYEDFYGFADDCVPIFPLTLTVEVFAMQISTTRFGAIGVDVEDLLHFPKGIMGFEECRNWVLLSDPTSDAVGWLQSAERPGTALPVISPRRFVPDYRVRVGQSQMAALECSDTDRIFALIVINHQDGRTTMNLRAPIMVNLDRCLGCQVITSDDQPLQAELVKPSVQLRKSA